MLATQEPAGHFLKARSARPFFIQLHIRHYSLPMLTEKGPSILPGPFLYPPVRYKQL